MGRFTIETRSDARTFGGVISGAGALQQIGTGTRSSPPTTPTRSGTTIAAGALRLGNGGSSGGVIGNVADNGVFTSIARSPHLRWRHHRPHAFPRPAAGRSILTPNNAYGDGTTIGAGALHSATGAAAAASSATSPTTGSSSSTVRTPSPSVAPSPAGAPFQRVRQRAAALLTRANTYNTTSYRFGWHATGFARQTHFISQHPSHLVQRFTRPRQHQSTISRSEASKSQSATLRTKTLTVAASHDPSAHLFRFILPHHQVIKSMTARSYLSQNNSSYSDPDDSAHGFGFFRRPSK